MSDESKPITINATPDAQKRGRFLVVSANGDELFRDTFDLNSATSRKRFVGATMRAAFKDKPADNWPDDVRENLDQQLAALAKVPPDDPNPPPAERTADPGEEPWPGTVDGPALLDD